MFIILLVILLLIIAYISDFPGGPGGFATAAKVWLTNKRGLPLGSPLFWGGLLSLAAIRRQFLALAALGSRRNRDTILFHSVQFTQLG